MQKYSDKEGYKLKASQNIYLALRSVCDFLIAFTAIVFLIPLFIVVAIAIKVDSKGPVFFCQDRIGRNGKIFKCIKFRSMAVEANHNVAGYEYAEVKAYITKVGAFIRKTSIDELPQLYNILAFQMSLIGYRPSQANEKELNDARDRYLVHQVKPGITGWAQVNGRDVLAAQPAKKAMFDNYYVQNVSLWLDIKIFFMTIAAVFKSDGIEEGTIEVKESEENKETEK